MQLKVLGSSSSGNCYLLENETECLVIEAGVHFSEVKKALDFNISKIVGCIVTHEHQDHAKYAMDYLKAGITVFCSEGTQEKISTGLLQPFKIYHGKKIKIGNFEVMPFDIVHDCAQPFGFLIKHPECGKILFLTDTHYSSYTFKGLNHLIVEANYSNEILQQRIDSGDMSMGLRRRIKTSHMSLETCKELLTANDLSQTMSICLIHLSSGNSNAKQFQSEVQALTGKMVYIAEKGLEYNIDLIPFL